MFSPCQWPPTSESLFLRSSLLPSFDLSLFSSLGSPPPLVIFATYSSLSTCNFIYIVILYLYMKTNSFFFKFYLSDWLIYEIEMQWSSKHGGHIAFSQMFPPWGNKYVKWHTNTFFLKEHSGFTSISYKHRFWLTAS